MKEKVAIMRWPTSLGLALTLAFVTSLRAQAQVALDVTKMTCEQFATYKIANPKFIAIWLNGYHHGTRGDTGRCTAARYRHKEDAGLLHPEPRRAFNEGC